MMSYYFIRILYSFVVWDKTNQDILDLCDFGLNKSGFVDFGWFGLKTVQCFRDVHFYFRAPAQTQLLKVTVCF